MVAEVQGVLTCRGLLVDSGLFCGLLVTVFGSRAIFIVASPLGALIYHSSTLTVLADSDLFHGLLLTVLGSQSHFLG